MKKKFIISSAVMVLVVSLTAVSFFIYSSQSQANLNTSDDICAVSSNSSTLASLQMEVDAYNETAESGAERVVLEFTGWMTELLPSFVNDMHFKGWELVQVIDEFYIFEKVN